jgi:ERCC4-related helicase
LLGSIDSEARVLVFVITRVIALRLKGIMKCFFPDLNPDLIVDKEGFSGQQIVLERFRKNETRLIVSTSVLEEGIDVQNCDVVMRFGGRPALI